MSEMGFVRVSGEKLPWVRIGWISLEAWFQAGDAQRGEMTSQIGHNFMSSAPVPWLAQVLAADAPRLAENKNQGRIEMLVPAFLTDEDWRRDRED